VQADAGTVISEPTQVQSILTPAFAISSFFFFFLICYILGFIVGVVVVRPLLLSF
jgi:hypothetical protein